MRQTAPARPSARVALVAVLVLVNFACARVVTLSPQEVAVRNESTWTIRERPPSTDSASPVTPLGAAPIAMRDRPDVREALASPPDPLGIPTALYSIDPILMAHRNEMRSVASARNQVGAGLIVFGLAFGALSVLVVSEGLKESNSSDTNMQNSVGQAVASGTIVGILALGELIAGTVMLLSSPDSGPLSNYYRETYIDR